MAVINWHDLSVSLAFIAKTSPNELAKEVLAGTLYKSDDQLTARGNISQPGSVADFAGGWREPKTHSPPWALTVAKIPCLPLWGGRIPGFCCILTRCLLLFVHLSGCENWPES